MNGLLTDVRWLERRKGPMNGPMNGFDERKSKGFGCQDAFLAAAVQRQRSDDAAEEPRGTIGHGGETR